MTDRMDLVYTAISVFIVDMEDAISTIFVFAPLPGGN